MHRLKHGIRLLVPTQALLVSVYYAGHRLGQRHPPLRRLAIQPAQQSKSLDAQGSELRRVFFHPIQHFAPWNGYVVGVEVQACYSVSLEALV